MKIRVSFLVIIISFIALSCTKRDLATIYTNNATSITATSAFVKMIIADDGGAQVAIGGICWDTIPTPTLDNKYTMNAWGKGEFNIKLNYLKPATKYYARGYGTNSVGTSYGNEINFTTLDTVIVTK